VVLLVTMLSVVANALSFLWRPLPLVLIPVAVLLLLYQHKTGGPERLNFTSADWTREGDEYALHISSKAFGGGVAVGRIWEHVPSGTNEVTCEIRPGEDGPKVIISSMARPFTGHLEVS
jgi:hypothetical protein